MPMWADDSDTWIEQQQWPSNSPIFANFHFERCRSPPMTKNDSGQTHVLWKQRHHICIKTASWESQKTSSAIWNLAKTTVASSPPNMSDSYQEREGVARARWERERGIISCFGIFAWRWIMWLTVRAEKLCMRKRRREARWNGIAHKLGYSSLLARSPCCHARRLIAEREEDARNCQRALRTAIPSRWVLRRRGGRSLIWGLIHVLQGPFVGRARGCVIHVSCLSLAVDQRIQGTWIPALPRTNLRTQVQRDMTDITREAIHLTLSLTQDTTQHAGATSHPTQKDWYESRSINSAGWWALTKDSRP